MTVKVQSLDELDIRVSAIVDGIISGRVHLLGPKGGRSKGRQPPPERPRVALPLEVLPHTTKFPSKLVSFRVPRSFLEELDDACLMTQMSRTRFLRQAAKHSYPKILSREWTFQRDVRTTTTQVQITMTLQEIAELDAARMIVQLSRSHFLRQAAKYFYTKIFTGDWRREAAQRRARIRSSGGAR